MVNHKKVKAKKQRAGCVYCKPQKMNGARNGREHLRPNQRRQLQTEE